MDNFVRENIIHFFLPNVCCWLKQCAVEIQFNRFVSEKKFFFSLIQIHIERSATEICENLQFSLVTEIGVSSSKRHKIRYPEM